MIKSLIRSVSNFKPKGQTSNNNSNELPTWSKGVIAVVLLGASGFAIYKLYSFLQKRKEQENITKEVETTKTEIQKIEATGKKGTLTDLQIQQYANKLQSAFDGYGTRADQVYILLANFRNDIDILNLKRIYGIRKISSGRLNLAPDFEGTLDQTIIDELSKKQISDINLMLGRKGIKYKF